MKKITAVMLTFIAVLSVLSGCSSVKLKKEAEIIQDMNENRTVKDGYISQCRYVENDDYTVDTFEITRRQTNTDKKEDIVIGNATIKNSYFSTDIVCKLTYNYYDNGGWVLDECEFLTDDTSPSSYPLRGVEISRVEFDDINHSKYPKMPDGIRHNLNSDEMVPEQQNFTQTADGWVANVLYVYYGNHYTEEAKMCFVFDQKHGWIIDSSAHGKYSDAILTNIKYDFSVLTGTFVGADDENCILVINSFDEEKNIITGSYVSTSYVWAGGSTVLSKRTAPDFTATFDNVKMEITFSCHCEYLDSVKVTLSYNFNSDRWVESRRTFVRK